MNKIAFVGFGELGEQLWEFIQHSYLPAVRIVFDDTLHGQGLVNAYPFEEYEQDRFKDYHFFIGLGYRRLALKAQVLQRLKELGRSLPRYVHPTCHVAHTAQIGAATYLYPMCNIDRKVQLGEGVLLNNSVVVSHSSLISDNCFLAPSVTVCGYVQVGNGVFIGAGSTVSNGVSIGAGSVIGLGSVVTKNLPNGTQAVGNPLRVVHKPIQLK
ncbi:MAG TPA: acetyltransferase [Chitinophagales bacterium]|nr:acetyltransferase [Chitinophagales bacterium]HRK27117.1 acetyltransferase [Chitinophagales bacterium]